MVKSEKANLGEWAKITYLGQRLSFLGQRLHRQRLPFWVEITKNKHL